VPQQRNAPQRSPVTFVLKGYPRLSETFIAQEILALEQHGLDIRIVSLRHPTDAQVHPVNRDISAPVLYLPEYLYQEPWRVLRAWWRARRLPGYARARAAWRADYRRDRTANRGRRWGQALVLADELPRDVQRLHAHFLHTPASVTRYAALMHEIAWTCSAHAKDIWTSPDWELGEKLDAARWTVTCTRVGRDRLAGLARQRDRVHLVYHGLDLSRFEPPGTARPSRDGSDADAPVELLTVGRAVEKKGLDILLDALAQLPAGLHWRWHHVGGGELLGELEAHARALDIAARVVWHGAKAQEFVLGLYRACDMFVLPCRVARDGDRDGLPNVLMEAASQGLVCVSTPVSGVPELLEDGETGVLVEAENAGALAGAIVRLARDPELRRHLGDRAQARVRAAFDHQGGIARLLELFDAG
jgi:glycosyltransferase involved in cell wall biosynthesis